MEIRAGGGVIGLGNPGGRGSLVVPEILVEGGSKKSCHPSGGVDFFWNNPFLHKNIHDLYSYENIHVLYSFKSSSGLILSWVTVL